MIAFAEHFLIVFAVDNLFLTNYNEQRIRKSSPRLFAGFPAIFLKTDEIT